MAGMQSKDSTRIDSDQINDFIVNGGTARKVAPHRETLPKGGQTFRQNISEKKNPLRTVLDPDSSRYRSQYGTKFKDHDIPFVIDGLQYGRFELERVNMNEFLPYDKRQEATVDLFVEAEDRLFFAGDPLLGYTGFANEGTTVGTHFCVNAAAELDLTTDVTMTATLAAMIGQMADHFKGSLEEYSLLLAVSTDVDDRINGYKNATTGARMKPELLSILAENGNGGAGIHRTDWLGAALKLGNGNLPIMETKGTTHAALMAWSESKPKYEVLSTGIIVDEGIDEVGRLTANFTEGYLPIQYDPYSIIQSAVVTLP